MTTFFEENKQAKLNLPQQGLRTALSVAGLDPSGGAGIIADVRTFDALDVYGTAVAATLTFQSTLGVKGRFDVPADVITDQLEALFADRTPNAIKTGALGSSGAARAVGLFLTGQYHGPVVVDPVLAAGKGGKLLDDDGASALITYLIGGAALVTPNVAEVEFLSGFKVFDVEDAQAAALRIVATGARAALVTGLKVVEGGDVRATDVFCDGQEMSLFSSPWIEGLEVHGTGCVLSAAITACLARGMALKDSVLKGREVVRASIAGCVSPGRGVACADPWALGRAEAKASAEPVLESK